VNAAPTVSGLHPESKEDEEGFGRYWVGMSDLQAKGQALLDALRKHVLEIFRTSSDCAPDASGLSNSEIEAMSGLALHLEKQDQYLVWSVLRDLVRKGLIVEVRAQRGRARIRYRRSC
jgi:hypothetical protein